MKAIAFKVLVALFGAFAGYYTYFLVSVFYELYGPNHRMCGTPQVWALQAGEFLFAPVAMFGSIVLWFVGRRAQIIGKLFSIISHVEAAILLLCAGANSAIFLPIWL